MICQRTAYYLLKVLTNLYIRNRKLISSLPVRTKFSSYLKLMLNVSYPKVDILSLKRNAMFWFALFRVKIIDLLISNTA